MFFHISQFIFSFSLSYLSIAAILPELKKRLLDSPNARSSHVIPTPRGAGIAFVIVGSVLHGLFTVGAIRWVPFI